MANIYLENISQEEREKIRDERIRQEHQKHLEDWKPKTALGKLVKTGKIKYLDEALKYKILEPEIIDVLSPNLKSEILNIEIPTLRIDISIPEDLIEEIGRIYGYEEIPAVFPVVSLIPPKKNFQIFWKNHNSQFYS